MKKRFVISNIQKGLPINSTILYTFLLYYFQVDGLYWGIFITLFTLYWISRIYTIATEERIDLNKQNLNDEKRVFRSKLMQALENLKAKK